MAQLDKNFVSQHTVQVLWSISVMTDTGYSFVNPVGLPEDSLHESAAFVFVRVHWWFKRGCSSKYWSEYNDL